MRTVNVNGVVINNVDADHDRYIVARYSEDGWWYWGSWDDADAAYRVACQLENGKVFDTDGCV